jgi:hypothetical protein
MSWSLRDEKVIAASDDITRKVTMKTEAGRSIRNRTDVVSMHTQKFGVEI